MDWIDVNIEQPKNRQEVIIMDSDGKCYECYYREVMSDYVAEDHAFQFKRKVDIIPEFEDHLKIITHWIPIHKNS